MANALSLFESSKFFLNLPKRAFDRLTCNWRLRQEIVTKQEVLRSRFLDHRISGKSEINITVRKRLRHSGLDESICSKDWLWIWNLMKNEKKTKWPLWTTQECKHKWPREKCLAKPKSGALVISFSSPWTYWIKTVIKLFRTGCRRVSSCAKPSNGLSFGR